jgi:homoaconitase/3-isopropylmalate dehydratase large subunit
VNIIEKSLAERANLDKVIPRDRVTIEPSVLFISEKSAIRVRNEFLELGYQKILHPSQAIFTCESEAPSNQFKVAENVFDLNWLKVREKNERFLVEFFNEEQDVLNKLVVAGVDSQISILGAYGIIPLIISSTAMACCLGTGKIEIVIPETIYIEINGFLKNGANAESICDYLLDYFKDSLVGCGIIIGGNTVERLNQEERRIITRFINSSGGVLGIISPKGPLGQVESVVKIQANHIPEHTGDSHTN